MAVTAKVIEGAVRYFDENGAELTLAQAQALAPVTETTAEINRRALVAKAQNALTSNATYLAIPTPTNAQNLAQIRSLTRQVNALIRLTVKALEGTSGT
jgi:hypothetical protein